MKSDTLIGSIGVWGMSDPGTAPRARRKSSIRAVFMEVSWRQVQRSQPIKPKAGGGSGGEVMRSLTSVISHRRYEGADPLPEVGGHRVPHSRQQQQSHRDHQYA